MIIVSFDDFPKQRRKVHRMKKFTLLLWLSLSVILLETVSFFYISSQDALSGTAHYIIVASLIHVSLWLLGVLYICIKKGIPHKLFTRLISVLNAALSAVVLIYVIVCTLAAHYPYQGNFSVTTNLFRDKNVMILVPHQDDEINLAGGLIEQYIDGGSDVSVVFTTNGDRFGESEVRAKETVSVLTALGVPQENIYYLGFGDQWQAQTQNGQVIPHIYNSMDPDALWTSDYGATATYGTATIDCYLELPYTRNNYLHSLVSLIQELAPDTIFAADCDSHPDHKATSLFFEEAMGEVLKRSADYHPTVYKGFCYGTAWHAPNDFFDSINLLSTPKPRDSVWEATGCGYSWENRVRFPLSQTNLNKVLSNNSVFDSLNRYPSQKARPNSACVLNGDKVFWHRRTDSLLYQAAVFIDGEQTGLLNDFKLNDYRDLTASPGENIGVAYVSDKIIRIEPAAAVLANCIALYDNPDPTQNILSGYIRFSDGSEVTFTELDKGGAITEIPFPEREIQWLEIVVTQSEGAQVGLCEIELYRNTPEQSDTYLMAADTDGNFVYDYVLQDTDTLTVNLYSYPQETPLCADDVQLTFASTGEKSTYEWDGDSLVIRCAEKEQCQITVSMDSLRTTFTVSNPGRAENWYVHLLRSSEQLSLKAEMLLRRVIDYVYSMLIL